MASKHPKTAASKAANKSATKAKKTAGGGKKSVKMTKSWVVDDKFMVTRVSSRGRKSKVATTDFGGFQGNEKNSAWERWADSGKTNTKTIYGAKRFK